MPAIDMRLDSIAERFGLQRYLYVRDLQVTDDHVTCSRYHPESDGSLSQRIIERLQPELGSAAAYALVQLPDPPTLWEILADQ